MNGYETWDIMRYSIFLYFVIKIKKYEKVVVFGFWIFLCYVLLDIKVEDNRNYLIRVVKCKCSEAIRSFLTCIGTSWRSLTRLTRSTWGFIG